MNFKFINLFFLLSVFLFELSAISLDAQAYGKTKEEAKNNALLDLSYKIYTNVESSFYKNIKQKDKQYSKKLIKNLTISTKVPLLGLKYKYFFENGLHKVSVKITSKNSLTLYLNELDNLSKEINSHKNIFNYSYSQLETLLSLIKNYKKYRMVAYFFKAKEIKEIFLSESKIKNLLIEKEQKIDNLKLAAKVLAKNIKEKNVFIFAAKTAKTNEITQFSRILKKELSSNINSVNLSSQGEYFYRGKYEILKDSIFVSYTLLSRNNQVLKSSSINIDKKAYSNLTYKIKHKSFDEAINSEFVKSDKLFVNLGFKGFYQENGIALIEGDLVDIVAKSNKPICYFIVGHILQEDKEMSYLLPLGTPESPFINYITGDDVNQLITLASNIPITKPFGRENLQMIAASYKNSCNLKVPFCKENEDNYCVLEEKPKNNILLTRGLNFKKKTIREEKSEAMIHFNTFAK